MSNKPIVFIGSSTEGLTVAQVIADGIDNAETVMWNRGVFGIGQGTIDALLKCARKCDFAILVATADDMVHVRETTKYAPRDNVIFELGLFMGALDQDRTALVACGNPDTLQIPTDLNGITQGRVASYQHAETSNDWDSALTSEVKAVTQALCQRLQDLERRAVCLEVGLTGHYVYTVTGADADYQHGGSCEIRYESGRLTIRGVRSSESRSGTKSKVQRTWNSRWMLVTENTMTFEYDITLPNGGARGLCNFALPEDMSTMTGEFSYLAPENMHGSIALRRRQA